MNRLQRRFEEWASCSEWAGVLPLDKENGAYSMPSTRIAHEAWVASQADVIDMIAAQDYPEEAADDPHP